MTQLTADETCRVHLASLSAEMPMAAEMLQSVACSIVLLAWVMEYNSVIPLANDSKHD